MSGVHWPGKPVSWNPVVGCGGSGLACESRCWAKEVAQRFPAFKDVAAWDGTVALREKILTEPTRRRKPTLYAVSLMGDLFHEKVPVDWIAQVFDVMARCSHHRFILLTKRPARMEAYIKTLVIDSQRLLGYYVRYDKGTDSPATQRVDDRQRGAHLARCAQTWTGSEARRRVLPGGVSIAVYPQESGTSQRPGIPASDGDDKWPAIRPDGASLGVDAFPRSYPSGPNHQSQERNQGRQPAREHGVGDHVGTTDTRPQCPARQPQSSDGQQAPQNAPHGSERDGNKGVAGGGSEGNRHRRSIQHEPQSHIGNMPPPDVDTHLGWPLPNVWLGVSVTCQQDADERIPLLLATPAAHRWVSVEPCLSDIDLRKFIGGSDGDTQDGLRPNGSCVKCGLPWETEAEARNDCPPGFGPTLDALVCGCESGPNRRPMSPAWAAGLAHQCQSAGVAFYLKQSERFGKVEGHGLPPNWPWKVAK